MNPIAISAIVFACVFGGAVFGMLLRSFLPENHLSTESRQIVNLGTGVIATMAALVLGLLVASAKSSYDMQSNEVTDASAKIIFLDRVLAHYGPETKEARDLLRIAVAQGIDRTWPTERSQRVQLESAPATSDALFTKIVELSPQNDTQRTIKAQALAIGIALGQTRWLMFVQESNSISTPLLTVVVFWLTINFTSFGLFAPRNATVIGMLLLCALAVSGAIFLVMELYRPFEGLIRISSAPLRNALAQLGH